MLMINAIMAAIVISVAFSTLSAISRRIATKKNDDRKAFITAQSLSFMTDIIAHKTAHMIMIAVVSSSKPHNPTVIKMTVKEQIAPQIKPKAAEHTLRI